MFGLGLRQSSGRFRRGQPGSRSPIVELDEQLPRLHGVTVFDVNDADSAGLLARDDGRIALDASIDLNQPVGQPMAALDVTIDARTHHRGDGDNQRYDFQRHVFTLVDGPVSALLE